MTTAPRSILRLTAACLLATLRLTYGSDVVEVLPLTRSILMVHFDDGYIDYHEEGENRNKDVIVSDPLDTAAVMAVSAYTISSADDPAYASAVSPDSVGRKTKGNEEAVCDDPNNSFVLEHWLYLFLPSPMRKGKTYTVTTGSLAKNGSEWELAFNEHTARSEAVHVNIVGYSILAPEKYAYLYHWMGDKGSLGLSSFEGKKFQLVSTDDGTVAFEGTIAFRQSKDHKDLAWTQDAINQNLLYTDVWDCDFSSFNAVGTYVIAVDGIGCSFPFEIKADALRKPFYYVMKGIYHNRCGHELAAKHTETPRPACHHPGVTPGFDGHVKYSTTRMCDITSESGSQEDWDANMKGELDTWGWYHDAGDWDGYTSHYKVPAWLLFTYEHYADNFTDGELDIAESGNGIPDILDEAAWLLRFYRRTRLAVKEKGWGSGGVAGGRVQSNTHKGYFCENAGTRASYHDTCDLWVVSGEDPFMSFLYAGMTAQLAWLYERDGLTDPEGVDWKQEAIETYDWAQNNTRAGDTDAKNHHYYGCRMYGAASLFRITGEAKYNDQFIADAQTIGLKSKGIDFTNWGTRKPGVWVYANIPVDRAVDAGWADTCYQIIGRTANFIMLWPQVKNRACRWSGNWWKPLNIGEGTTPLILDGTIGYALMKDRDPDLAAEILPRLYTTADYFLGTNPLNMTWVVGLGERHPTQMMHLDSWYNGKDKLNIGFVPYGPYHTAMDFNWHGVYSHVTDFKSVYPPGGKRWPPHERFFNTRYSIATGEFTVHQTNNYAAAVYGALCAPPGTAHIAYRGEQNGLRNRAGRTLNVACTDGVVRIGLGGTGKTRLTVTISNLAGRRVLRRQVLVAAGTPVRLSPSLSRGLYLLSVQGKQMGSTQAMMVR